MFTHLVPNYLSIDWASYTTIEQYHANLWQQSATRLRVCYARCLPGQHTACSYCDEDLIDLLASDYDCIIPIDLGQVFRQSIRSYPVLRVKKFG